MDAPPQELSAQETAELLTAELGGSPARWVTWLKNDRRPGRARQLAPLPGPGRPRYTRAAVEAFITANLARRLKAEGPSGRVAAVLKAVGIGEAGGSPTGRRLDCQVTAQVDRHTGAGFVQVAVAQPFLIFRLELAEARELADQLHREANDAEHLTKLGAQP